MTDVLAKQTPRIWIGAVAFRNQNTIAAMPSYLLDESCPAISVKGEVLAQNVMCLPDETVLAASQALGMLSADEMSRRIAVAVAQEKLSAEILAREWKYAFKKDRDEAVDQWRAAFDEAKSERDRLRVECELQIGQEVSQERDRLKKELSGAQSELSDLQKRYSQVRCDACGHSNDLDAWRASGCVCLRCGSHFGTYQQQMMLWARANVATRSLEAKTVAVEQLTRALEARSIEVEQARKSAEANKARASEAMDSVKAKETKLKATEKALQAVSDWAEKCSVRAAAAEQALKAAETKVAELQSTQAVRNVQKPDCIHEGQYVLGILRAKIVSGQRGLYIVVDFIVESSERSTDYSDVDPNPTGSLCSTVYRVGTKDDDGEVFGTFSPLAKEWIEALLVGLYGLNAEKTSSEVFAKLCTKICNEDPGQPVNPARGMIVRCSVGRQSSSRTPNKHLIVPKWSRHNQTAEQIRTRRAVYDVLEAAIPISTSSPTVATAEQPPESRQMTLLRKQLARAGNQARLWKKTAREEQASGRVERKRLQDLLAKFEARIFTGEKS